MATRIELTKQDLRERGLMRAMSRGWSETYYEQDGHVYCYRWKNDAVQLLVLRLGVNPIDPSAGVRLYWDEV